MKTKMYTTVSLLLFFIAQSQFTLLAQNYEFTPDPLNKPDLWKNIEENPNDLSYWANYIGKTLHSLNKEDEAKIIEWKSAFALFAPAIDIVDEDIWKDIAHKHHYNPSQEHQMELEYSFFHKELREHMLQESPVLNELKGNIAENFVIIEDVFQLEFEELGTHYEFYADVHPDGKFPQTQWIEEKSQELHEIKVLNFKLIIAKASGTATR